MAGGVAVFRPRAEPRLYQRVALFGAPAANSSAARPGPARISRVGCVQLDLRKQRPFPWGRSRMVSNLPWGTGDTPLKEILQLMKKERDSFPASIELEYEVSQGSNAVKEVAKCLD